MLVKASGFKATPYALFYEPEFHVFDYHPIEKTTRFIIAREELITTSPFLDIRFEPIRLGEFSISSNKIFELETKIELERPAPNFIFHHAFVCSTLLARCLNESEDFTSLSEPWILRRLADIKRNPKIKYSGTQWDKLVKTHIQLLVKNYAGSKSVVVKSTNMANSLMDGVLTLFPNSKSVYLHSDLESFLVSNLKKNDQTKAKIPELTKIFLTDTKLNKSHPELLDFQSMSFIEVCAVLWFANLVLFKQQANNLTGDNLRTISMDDFLSAPKEVLLKLSEFFNHPADELNLKKMVAPKILNKNAKDNQQIYNVETRAIEYKKIIDQHEHAIQKSMSWIAPLVEEFDLLHTMKSREL